VQTEEEEHRMTLRDLSLDTTNTPLFLSNDNENFSPSSNIVRLSILTTADLGTSLLYLVENYPVTIVCGQTGCGKSTRMTHLKD
jgi:HrpA-like RNA helicase